MHKFISHFIFSNVDMDKDVGVMRLENFRGFLMGFLMDFVDLFRDLGFFYF